MPMTDQELAAAKKTAQQLCDLCQLHGYPQPAMVHKHTVEAISAEQAHRSRGGSPQG